MSKINLAEQPFDIESCFRANYVWHLQAWFQNNKYFFK